MTDPKDAHPLAPKPGTKQEGPGETHNDPTTVEVRSGVELGAMRYVLIIGLIVGVAAVLIALFGGLAASGN